FFHREPIPIIDSVKNPTAKHTFWAGVNQFKELLIAAIEINVNDSPDIVPPIIIYTSNAFLVDWLIMCVLASIKNMPPNKKGLPIYIREPLCLMLRKKEIHGQLYYS